MAGGLGVALVIRARLAVGVVTLVVALSAFVLADRLAAVVLVLSVTRAAGSPAPLVGQIGVGVRTDRAEAGFALVVLLAVVAAIMASDKPSKQAWPDDVAGSVVVKRV